MYQEDFPHQEYPNGIIKLSVGKKSKVINLVKRYNEIGYKDYNLVELAELTLGEWRRKAYPIPKGYRVSWGNYLVKNDLKSNPIVK